MKSVANNNKRDLKDANNSKAHTVHSHYTVRSATKNVEDRTAMDHSTIIQSSVMQQPEILLGCLAEDD